MYHLLLKYFSKINGVLFQIKYKHNIILRITYECKLTYQCFYQCSILLIDFNINSTIEDSIKLTVLMKVFPSVLIHIQI